jgi:hypothetical protein
LTITTTANMAVPSGAQSITVTGTTSGGNVTHTTAPMSVTITTTNQSFAIAVTGGTSTFSVAPGATASVPINVKGTNGFIITSGTTVTTALPLTYSCAQSSLPADVACAFSPGSGNSVSVTTLALNISTTAPTSQLRTPLGRGNHLFYALMLPGLFGIVFAAGSRTRTARFLSLIIVLGFSTLWLGGCSGGSSRQSNPGTPAGTYAIVVNATTGGSIPLTNTLTVNLTVQ